MFGPRYLALRRLTEDRLLELFTAAGGQPVRRTPHYLVLGDSPWFAGLSPHMAEVAVALTDLPSDVVSLTYGDSFTAMAFGPRFGLPYEPRPYHGQVFRIEGIAPLIDRFGMPARTSDPYADYQRRPLEEYVEIQLWSDEPIRHLLQPPSTREAMSATDG